MGISNKQVVKNIKYRIELEEYIINEYVKGSSYITSDQYWRSMDRIAILGKLLEE